jgi:hypothetical protein
MWRLPLVSNACVHSRITIQRIGFHGKAQLQHGHAKQADTPLCVEQHFVGKRLCGGACHCVRWPQSLDVEIGQGDTRDTTSKYVT